MKLSLHASDISYILGQSLKRDPDWLPLVDRARNFHLAVFVEPFLTYLLDGKKTIESRFTRNRVAPFGQVFSGDLLLLKRSGGPIVGVALVHQPEFLMLSKETWPRVLSLSKKICADEEFWRQRLNKKYATLLEVTAVRHLNSVEVVKADRRPWVVLPKSTQATLPISCA